VQLQGPAGWPTYLFVRVPEPKTVKNRIHLDVNATDRNQAAEVERILALGATRVDIGQGKQSWVVLADPEATSSACCAVASTRDALMARVVVIGAGLGGLACAARLSTLGHDVVVCEAAPVVGGKLGTYSRDGFTFDTGPSLLTLPAVYRDLFIKTGAAIESVLDVVPVDPVCSYRFPDGTELDLPNGPPDRIRVSLDDALGVGAGEDWQRFPRPCPRHLAGDPEAVP
jgi:NADPH-dependent 2,4-dienoyl-CoA reductase/sulfur reductase-like enzyme